MNKHLILLLLSLGLGTSLFGQHLLTVSGIVLDTGNVGLPNAPVILEVYGISGNVVFYDSAFTAGNGRFDFSANIADTAGFAVTSTPQCVHGSYYDTTAFVIPGQDSLDVTLYSCPNLFGCGASLTNTYQGSGTFTFTEQTNGFAVGSVTYDFGDGTTGNSSNPTHTYATPGSYSVSASFMGTSGCQTVAYTRAVYPAGSGCTANFFTDVDSVIQGGFGFHFYANSAPYTTYSWDFGDSTTGSGLFVQHTFSDTGYYAVCLTTTDTFTNCVATYCDTVFAPGGNVPCVIEFSSYAPFGLPYGALSFQPNYLNQSVAYSWDFGDGNTSTLPNPTHLYLGRGTFQVCLTTTNATGCTNTYCDSVFIDPNPLVDVYGTVFKFPGDTLFGDIAEVYLIVFDSAAGSLTAIDTVLTDSIYGGFRFAQVPAGEYLFKAALLPSSPSYGQYLPTYSDSVLRWDQALSYQVAPSSRPYIDVILLPGNNPGGPGFIGGLISQGANKRNDPLDQIEVMLITSTGLPVASTITDATGAYSFSNLAYGDYQLWVEIPGKMPTVVAITLDAANPTISEIDFEVFEDDILPATTSIEGGLTGNWKLYPNPVADRLTIQAPEATLYTLRLSDLRGQRIQERVINRELNTSLEMSSLLPGVYFLEIETESERQAFRLIKTE